jgi:copper chaperone CopZ
MKRIITLKGMTSLGCAGRVQKALSALEGVEAAAVSPEDKQAAVTLSAPVEDAALRAAVESAGCEAAWIERTT